MDCLFSTADDVGPKGKDIYTGSGVVNTDAALGCLRSQACCLAPQQEEISTETPSFAPTFAPTMSPTSKPSRKPTISPTKSPSAQPTQGPSRSPTLSPTLSSHTQCSLHCEDKNQFCSYKANRTCSNEKETCVLSCESAILDGKLESGLREMCETVWCDTDLERCITEQGIACDADYSACIQLCR